MKSFVFVTFFFSISIFGSAQSLSTIQMQNARATGYAIIAAKNPGVSFSVLLIPWDGINTLEYNAQTQINTGWHAQAAIKGNYFNQAFDGSNFSDYSSVVVSQADFDLWKSTGTQWWIACSTLPAFSNSHVSLNNSKLGIGTVSEPISLLHINGSASGGESAAEGSNPNGSITISSSGTGVIANMGIQANVSPQYFWIQPRYINQPYFYNTVLNPVGGSVGIGTKAPIYKLETVTSGPIGFRLQTNGSNIPNPQIDMLDISTGLETVISSSDGLRTGTYVGSYSNHPLMLGTNHSQAQLYLSTNGNFGIGTTTPSDKLSVNGNIRTKKLIVSQSNWPDYVFSENYKLMPLIDLEKYVKKYNHLPEIPSAKNVNEHGVDVGKSYSILLKKIEELTLYMISQEKKINKQNILINKLIKKNE